MHTKLVVIDVHSPAGAWFSPPVSGARPPPCSGFTLTAIDSHRAVLFGGWQPGGGGRVSDLYLIDFNTMVKCHCIVLHEHNILECARTLSELYRIWSQVRRSHGQWGEAAMQPVVLDMLEITFTCW